MLGPHDVRVVSYEPGHAEDDRVAANTGDIELDCFFVGADRELNWRCFLDDKSGRTGATVHDFKYLWHGFGSEADACCLGECGVDERRRSATVDHRIGYNGTTMEKQVNR